MAQIEEYNIWRQDWVCQHDGSLCRLRASGACVFRHRMQCLSDDWEALQTHTLLLSQRLSSTQRRFFGTQGGTKHTTTTTTTVEAEPESPLVDEMWREVCPCLEPLEQQQQQPPPPDYEHHPHHFIRGLGLQLRESSCTHLGVTSATRHRRLCAGLAQQAHSLGELLAPYQDERVRSYFAYWLALSGGADALRVRQAGDPALKCRLCGERARLVARLCIMHPALGKSPAIKLRCMNSGCRVDTIVSIYEQ